MRKPTSPDRSGSQLTIVFSIQLGLDECERIGPNKSLRDVSNRFMAPVSPGERTGKRSNTQQEELG